MAPIRLKIGFPNAAALIAELTACISRGGFKLKTSRSLPAGTEFLFEMQAEGSSQPVEVVGKVIRSEPAGQPNAYEVEIAYSGPTEEDRPRLEHVLTLLFEQAHDDKARKAARVPVNLPAKDGGNATRRYLVRDISLGGLGLRVPVDQPLPPKAQLGARAIVGVTFNDGNHVVLRGTVVWTAETDKTRPQGGIGMGFAQMGAKENDAISLLCQLVRPKEILVTFIPPLSK